MPEPNQLTSEAGESLSDTKKWVSILSDDVIELLPDAIALADHAGTIIYMNRAAEILFGSSFYSAQELTAYLKSRPEGTAIWSSEDRKGAQRTFEVKWKPFEEHGEVRYLLTLYDVSAYQQMVEEIKEKEQRYQYIADFTYDWEYWIAPDGDLVYVSPACKRITGYDEDEFISQPGLLFSIVHPEDQQLFIAHRAEVQNNQDAYSLDFRIIDREGTTHWIGHKCQPVYDVEGKYIGQRVSNRDLTVRKHAEQALFKLNQELETRVAERTSQLRQEIAVRMKAENEISNRLRIETTIAKISAAFIQISDFPSAINQVLQSIGQLTNANRVALFCSHEYGQSFECSHEWCNTRIVSQTREQKAISGGYFSRWIEEYQDVTAIHIENLANLPPGYLPGIDAVTGEPSKTLILLPINSNTELLGFLSLENIPISSYWHEQYLSLLGIVAQIVGSSLERSRIMETLEQRVVDRTRELKALYEVAAITSQPIRIEEMLELLLCKIIKILDKRAGFIHLLDEDEQNYRLMCTQAIPEELRLVLEDPKWIQDIHPHLSPPNRQVITFELASAKESFLSPFADFRSYLGLPIRIEGSWIGLISILGDTHTTLTRDQNSLLVTIVDRVSVAIDSARLRKQSEEAAISKERERVARELHDSVTQSLYALTLMARVWQREVDTVQPEEVDRWLKRVGSISNQALKEMRLLVYDLLPNTLRKDGLSEALKRRLDTVESRLNIVTTLEVENDLKLPAKTEQELYRIAQEALNNVLKHSEATQAYVSIRDKNGQIELEISDNGIGFDPDVIQEGHGLGIANMRTRAERLGGCFQLTSNQNSGTRVWVILKPQ